MMSLHPRPNGGYALPFNGEMLTPQSPDEGPNDDMNESNLRHRPGAISMFFIYKAGVFAAGFWIWLALLAILRTPVGGWNFVAATGAVTTTLVAVVLGVRCAIQRNAAERHAEIMKTLVEISWYSFATGTTGASGANPAGYGVPANGVSAAGAAANGTTPVARLGEGGEGADVIQLPQDPRQRPRR